MKTKLVIAMALALVQQWGRAEIVNSPDGKLSVDVSCTDGKPTYSVTYNGAEYLASSPLGITTNVGDFTNNLRQSNVSPAGKVDEEFSLYNTKNSHHHYVANEQTFTYAQGNRDVIAITFRVSNNDVAFRYQLLPKSGTTVCVVRSEATQFVLPEGATTFLCPQMGAMTGFARTAPSYETHYTPDDATGKNGNGTGYTFPCLFKVSAKNKQNGWVLISETGVDGNYCASRLENKGDRAYQITFPSDAENNGWGSSCVQALLPSYTPWRTITVGESLKPIVETNVAWDVLNDQYPINDDARKEVAQKYGRGAWSWIIADDASCNFDTQKQYVDFAAAMGWETLLIDAQWDTQIGRDRIDRLAAYARGKGITFYLWYNSNGKWNDAPQTPRNCMDNVAHRREEMAWMQRVGIRGIKVDFFGGDKQCTMQLYEDILRDAEAYGLMVIFHGCTLPRGWERMYTNYVASEAVRASENLRFNQSDCDREAMDATFHPFIRNTVGSMDFGGSTLNHYYNPQDDAAHGGGHRVTSDVFALATAVLFQSPVQHFAMSPGNLTSAPSWALAFMKEVPTQWDEVQFIDGYPGKYVILARRTGNKWYVVGVNAEKQTLKKEITLPMLQAGASYRVYSDDESLEGSVKQVRLNKKKKLTVTIPCNGGWVIAE
jgi:hypothetical protein